LLVLVPIVVQVFPGGDARPPAAATYSVEMIRLHLPDQVFFQASHSRREEASQAEKPAAPVNSQPGQQAAGAGRPRAPLPKYLELAIARHQSDDVPVILQPDETTLPTPSVVAAPPVAFWAQSTPPAPPQRRQAIIPGRVEKPFVPPNLDEPPVLSQPNQQPLAADIPAALAVAAAAPKLPEPNSSTNPIRMRGKGEAEIASFEAPQSDPLNLIALAANHSAARNVEIPKGLQNSPLSNGGGGTELTTGRAADAPVPAHAGRGGAADAPGHAAQASAADAAQPVGAARARAGGANSAGAERSQAEAQALRTPADRPVAEGSGPVPPPAPAGQDSAAVIRMSHPSNGNFDVVILQSVARDDLPDVGGTLSGNPVYTVYLKVGDEREWLLEYCIPASANSRASTYQVNIDDSGVVSAPYPLATVIPKNVMELPHPRHIVLHGLLSAAGVFRNMVGLDSENPLVREVLPLLSQWQFRPALRDKAPVEVEILLIIPARS